MPPKPYPRAGASKYNVVSSLSVSGTTDDVWKLIRTTPTTASARSEIGNEPDSSSRLGNSLFPGAFVVEGILVKRGQERVR